MRDADIKTLIEGIVKYPNRKLDLKKIKKLPHRRDDAKDNDVLYLVSQKLILEASVSKDISKSWLSVKQKDINYCNVNIFVTTV